MASDFIHHIFNGEHALGATKTPKRGVRHRIGFTAVGNDIHML